MKKILFPTDFSDTANNAFLYTLHLAKLYNAEVFIIIGKTKCKENFGYGIQFWLKK